MRLTSLRSPEFAVIPEGQVREVLVGSEPETVQLVAHTYLAHGRGETVNPPSYFLRFPEDPGSRIIALPAAVDHGGPVAGLKWIGSFPSNHDAGLPRASAVVILNDGETGFPFACLEGALISAERTEFPTRSDAESCATRPSPSISTNPESRPSPNRPSVR